MEELSITQEMTDAFLKAVDNEAFEVAEIAREMEISEDLALAILAQIVTSGQLHLKCVWVPVKK